MADIQLRVSEAERRLTSLGEELRELAAGHVEVDDLRAALLSFDPVWDSLEPKERARVIRLLVEAVVLDGASSKLAIAFRPSGIRALAEEVRAAREIPA